MFGARVPVTVSRRIIWLCLVLLCIPAVGAVNAEWTIEPDTCIRASDPEAGTACTPALNNTGNTATNISVNRVNQSPTGFNATEPNATFFQLKPGETQPFDVNYNVTVDPSITYTAVYNVSSSDAAPQEQYLNITIQPAVSPLINVGITPQEIVQKETVQVVANVTSRTAFNITDAVVTVTTPDGAVYQDIPMKHTQQGIVSEWRLFYPNGTNVTGVNTTITGVYTVNVTAMDEIGNKQTATAAFTVRPFLNDTLETLGEVYEQGDIGTIVYQVTDVTGNGVPGAHVNFSIHSDNLPFPLENDGNPYTTGSNGYTQTLPSFTLDDDFTAGLYTLVANATWTDPDTGYKVRRETRHRFAVEHTSNLTVQPDTGAVWTPGDTVNFHTVVSRNGLLQDPDAIGLRLFDPSGNEIHTASSAGWTQQHAGIYNTSYQLPETENTATGKYWAEIQVHKTPDATTRYIPFTVTTESTKRVGPFDINVTVQNSTRQQGSSVPFTASFRNLGPDAGDVKLTYAVKHDGVTHASSSEQVYAPSGTDITLPRQADLYTNVPTGTYTVHAEVEPLSSSIQPAHAMTTLNVTEKNEFVPPPPELITEPENRTYEPGNETAEENETRTNETADGNTSEENETDTRFVPWTVFNTHTTSINNTLAQINTRIEQLTTTFTAFRNDIQSTITGLQTQVAANTQNITALREENQRLREQNRQLRERQDDLQAQIDMLRKRLEEHNHDERYPVLGHAKNNRGNGRN